MAKVKTMKKLTAEDAETKSPDLVAENLEQLKALFPEALSEGKVDFEVLKQLLGGAVDEREEKYGLNWHGKRQARQLALTPSTGTLRPCPDDSVDWDTTKNLMIEGDNLEVLKLLQKSYAGKVKLIYIDPPYNTGGDFVYPDDFQDNIKNYLMLTGQIDSDGRRITSHTEASGRFHTDWLNMMYPRLKLAKSLLRNDGLILVSSDEAEADNLKRLCDEIFGEENFVERIVWKNKYGSGALTKGFANVHEYILVYSRDPIEDIAAPLDDEQRAAYKLTDEKFAIRGGYLTQPLATTSKDARPNLVYPIIHKGHEIWPEKQWIWAKERFDQAYKNNEIVINESDGKFSVRAKQYLRDENGVERLGKPLSLMNGPFNQEGTQDIADLFAEKVFSFPKPTALLRYFVALVVNGDKSRDGVYLDFFAGSGTTAHAVMAPNAADGGHRRFILVELPEPLDPEDKSQKIAADFCDKLKKPRNIAELTKERLRRAGKKIVKATPLFKGDVGFRVFKLDSSNIREWEPDREHLAATLEQNAEHLKADRTEPDSRFDTVEILDPIMLALPRALNAVLDDIPKAFHLPANSVRRQDIPLVPRTAIREALVNAVMHRSYRQKSAVQIIRYANRLEIRNPGHSLVPDERLGEPGSVTRNEKIAAVLHETRYAETKGSGIRAMRESMAQANLTPPTFESDREKDCFVVTFLFHHFLNEEDVRWLGQFAAMELTEDEQKAVVFARELGAINNAAYRDINRVETLIASGHLRRLRDLGLLEQKGKSVGTFYVPTERVAGAPTATPAPDAQAQGFDELPPAIAESIGKLGKRASPDEARPVVRRLCAWKPLKADQIARYLGRRQIYVTRTYLTPMIRDGELEYVFPENPAHPQQAYRATVGGKK